MTITVQALFFASGHTSAPSLRGLFETVEGAEKRLLEEALAGTTVAQARIEAMTVIGTEPSRRAEDYPDVIAYLIEGKKIQAIKELRARITGMSLYEAKMAAERVQLLDLPQSTRDAAQAIVDARKPARHTFQHSYVDYDVLRADDGFHWVRVISGDYVRVDIRQPMQEDELPIIDGSLVLSEELIEERYGVEDRWDF